jgi:hypothetical protein
MKLQITDILNLPVDFGENQLDSTKNINDLLTEKSTK